jgi:hypothetical protein
MQRRDFVKGIAMASAVVTTTLGQQPASTPQPMLPVTPANGATTNAQTAMRRYLDFKAAPLPSSVPDVVAGTEAHFFTEQQLAALRKLSNLFMPALNGYPGATEAGTPEFIDFLIGVAPVDRQHMYQSGLDHLNAEAKRQFGNSFAEVSPAQADKLIRPGLVAWVLDHPPADSFKRFMAIAHRDIRTATMNSQAWSAAAVATGERAPGVGLYWSPIDPIV